MGMMGFRDRMASAFKKFRFPGIGGTNGVNGSMGGFWHGNRLLAGTQYDYRAGAGTLWENGVIAAAIDWECNAFGESPVRVERKAGPKLWDEIENHPLCHLLEDPNPEYDSSVLWAGTLISLAVSGNAYWMKVRSQAGIPVELYYIPHWHIRPRWPQDGSVFIQDYEYRPNGATAQYLKPQDIVHLRDGMDPANTRLGLGNLQAVLREVCTDNEGATYSAAMLRNRGIPGAILSPKDADTELAPEQMTAIREQFEERFTGDGRGRAMAFSCPISVETVGFSPADMILDKVRQLPAERICSVMHIPPGVLGISSPSNDTYANKIEANAEAWLNCIVPMQRRIGKQLKTQLLGDWEDDLTNLRVHFDHSEIPALSEQKALMYRRLTAAVGGPWLTPNEARSEAGLAAIEGGDELVEVGSSSAEDKEGPQGADGGRKPRRDTRGKETGSDTN